MAYTINNAMSFLKARLFRMRAKILLFSKKGDVGSKATYDFFPEDIWPRIKGDVRAEIALQLPRTKLCCVLLGKAPLHQSRIVARRNARSARTSPPTAQGQCSL